jgi:hypothetical protein
VIPTADVCRRLVLLLLPLLSATVGRMGMPAPCRGYPASGSHVALSFCQLDIFDAIPSASRTLASRSAS